MSISAVNNNWAEVSALTSTDRYSDIEQTKENKNATFEALFESAKAMFQETDLLTNQAEEEEIAYAMGYSDNIHQLMQAQQKANISLQYTVAVRNGVIDAYKEIMNLQF